MGTVKAGEVAAKVFMVLIAALVLNPATFFLLDRLHIDDDSVWLWSPFCLSMAVVVVGLVSVFKKIRDRWLATGVAILFFGAFVMAENVCLAVVYYCSHGTCV